jgi:hypothetical protein
MSCLLLPEEFVMRHDSRDHGRAIGPGDAIGPVGAIKLARLWKRRWLLAIAVLAAILGLGVLVSSVLRAYGESDYDYLTGVPTLSPSAGLA